MSSNSSNNTNDEDYGRKYHERVTPFGKPWLETRPISQIDVTNSEEYESTQKELTNISNNYVETFVRREPNSTSDIVNNLQSYYDIREPSLIDSIVRRVYSHPNVEIEPNIFRENSYIVKHRK